MTAVGLRARPRPSSEADAAREVLGQLVAWGLGLDVAVPARPTPSAGEALVQAAVEERMTGPLLLAADAGAVALAPEAVDRLAEHHRQALLWCLHLEARLVEVADWLAAGDLEALVVKGSALAHLDEGDPALRTFADIDLLVAAGDLDQAVVALEGRGARRRHEQRRPGYDRRFAKSVTLTLADGVEVDLHRTLSDGVHGVRIPLDRLFAHSVPLDLGGRRLRTLSPPHRMLHCCYHAVLGSETPRLASLRDLAGYLDRPDLGPSVVAEEAACWRGQAVLATAVAAALAAVPVESPDWVAWVQAHPPPARERTLLERQRAEGSGLGRAKVDVARRAAPARRARPGVGAGRPVPGPPGLAPSPPDVGVPRRAGPGRAPPAGCGGRRPRATPAVTALPAPSPGVVAVPLGRDLVLHDAARDLIHVLNPSAALVWEACEGGVGHAELIGAVADAAGLTRPLVAADIDAHLDELRGHGLVGRAPLPLPVPPPRTEVEPGPLRTRGLLVLGSVVVFSSDDAALVAAIDRWCAPLAVPCDPDVTFRVASVVGGGIAVRGQGHDEVVASSEALLDLVPSLLNRVAAGSTGSLTLHASAARAPSGEVVAIPAASGHGKSTLVASLVQRGWGYLTDEAVGICARDLWAISYPKPLALDAMSRRLLGLAPSGRAHASPDELRAGASVAPGPVGPVSLVVLPERTPARSPVIARLGPTAAVAALAGHALNLGPAGRRGVETLAGLAGSVPCVRIVGGGVDATTTAVEAMVRDLPGHQG